MIGVATLQARKAIASEYARPVSALLRGGDSPAAYSQRFEVSGLCSVVGFLLCLGAGLRDGQ